MKENTNKKAQKAELLTINAYHDRHGVDRRTIRKYLDEDGLEPAQRRNGLPYYRECDITRVILERHPHHTEATLGVQKDAAEWLKENYLAFFKAYLRLHCVAWTKEMIGWDWENVPANHAAIVKILKGPLSKQICALGNAIIPDSDEDTLENSEQPENKGETAPSA
jgi:hypothetical protein